MPSLFLSHSSIDKPFVEKLAKDLKRVGINVWFDKWNIEVGQSLTWKIEEGIRENDFFAIILSPEALDSEWVKCEMGAGWAKQMAQKRVFVLPILYRNCDIPWFLADRKYADFRTDYDRGFRELCSALGLKYTDSINQGNWRLFMNDRNVDWQSYRKQEFGELVTVLVDRAKQYNWSFWVGATKNPWSLTLSAFVDLNRKRSISVKMVKGVYKACLKDHYNPNELRSTDYTIFIGNSINACEEYVWNQMEDFKKQYGNPVGEAHYITEKFLKESEKNELIEAFLQKRDWYQKK